MDKKEVYEKTLKYFKGDEMAAKVFFEKYSFRQFETPQDMWDRLCKEFGRIEKKYERELLENEYYSLSEYGRKRYINTIPWEDYFHEYIDDFRYIIPGGSALANIGNETATSLSNCNVIESPEDTIEGIFRAAHEMSELFKRRGGVGVDLSTLRPNQAKVNNAAKSSSGAVSFMEFYSKMTEVISQNGRRGALMMSIDVRHPDVLDFIKVKRDTGKINGANISVKFNDEFFEVLGNRGDYILRFPIDMDINDFNKSCFDQIEYGELKEWKNGYIKKVSANEIWIEFVKSNWLSAEPGCMFPAMFERDPTNVYDELKPITTNPSLRKGTKILTTKGVYNIEDLEDKNIKVINLNNEVADAKCFLSGKNKKLYKVNLKGGHTYYATAEHMWSINGVKKSTIELKKGDKLPFLKRNVLFNNDIGNYMDGFFMGWCYGGACLIKHDIFRKKYRLIWLIPMSDEYSDIRELLLEYMKKHGDEEIERDTKITQQEIIVTGRKPNNNNNNNNNNNTKRKKIYSKIDCNNQTFINYILKFGDFKRYKGLPMSVFRYSEDFRKGFVDGVFSVCGKINHDGSALLKLPNPELAKDFSDLMGFYGIKNKISRKEITISTIASLAHFYCQFYITLHSHKDNILKYFNTRTQGKTVDQEEFAIIKSVDETDIFEDVWDITVYDTTNCFNLAHCVTGNCGELGLAAYDQCRLIAVNLLSLVKDKFKTYSSIDEVLAYRVFYECVVLGDNLVNLEIEAIERILYKINPDWFNRYMDCPSIEDFLMKQSREFQLWWRFRKKSKEGRRCGCEFTGYGDMCAALGLPYGDEDQTDRLFKLKLKAELDATIDMAIVRGKFPLWDFDKEYVYSAEDGAYKGNNSWYQFIHDEFFNEYSRMKIYGRRNSGFSTAGPTGSLSILTQTTSGIEPLFQPYYIRRKRASTNEVATFIDNQGNKFVEFLVVHPQLRSFYQQSDLKIGKNIEDFEMEDWKYIYDNSPYFKNDSASINPFHRIRTQSLIQKYITSSISSTVNLPKETTIEMVEDIYKQAFYNDLKGITIYRDGSRDGIMINEKDNSKMDYREHHIEKMPKVLDSDFHKIKYKGEQYIILVSLIKDFPVEIFCFKPTFDTIEENIPFKNIKEHRGKRIKIKKGLYSFESEFLKIPDLSAYNSLTEKQFCVNLSLMLRHGVPKKYIINNIKKYDNDITSFSSVCARILSKYLTETEDNGLCPSCNVGKLINENGCVHCDSCVYSKCG